MEKFSFNANEPIRLFEAFAGVGTQAMALKKLVEVEHVGISEIDKYAIESYNAIHGEVKNYGDIAKMTGGALPEIDIFTYSFPCQDLSKAGKQEGMGEGTRSGLVWEVVRILQEMPIKPKVLLMENVIDLVSAKFVDGFNELQYILSEMGYTNWNEILNARDFGVAQNRQRVFMVSILGEYVYTFPKPFPLEKKLKDYLEEKVEEKYFLSERLLKALSTNPKSGYDIGVVVKKPYSDKSVEKIRSNIVDVKGVSNTITANPQRATIDGATLFRTGESLRTRKLTPLEAWRLMGIKDEDFHKAKSSGMSDSQLYKQAGNAIVVDVLYYIFKNLIKD